MADRLCNDLFGWLKQPRAQGTFDEEEGAALEDAAHAAYWKTRAFAGHGEGQADMCRAADYTDEWFNTGDRSFRCYYVCMAGTGWGTKCGHAVLSSTWGRALADPWAAKQRWHCTQRPARHKPKYGVLLELIFGRKF